MSWKVIAPRKFKDALRKKFGMSFGKGFSEQVYGNDGHKMTIWYWCNRGTRVSDVHMSLVEANAPEFKRFFKKLKNGRTSA